MSRRLLGALGGVVLVVVALAVLLGRVRGGPPLPSGGVTLAGLDGPVEVLWDEYGIPQLWAGSMRDALMAQGWLHARHRLWQVELFRRAARGRLSEIFGPTTLETDRFLRTLDMDGAAERGIPLLSAEERSLLEAYAAGMNAAIEDWPGLLPPEFLVLGIEPEPYTLVDVLTLEKIMAFDLAQYSEALGLVRLEAEIGTDSLAALPVEDAGGTVTILGSAGLDDRPVPGTAGEAAPVASGSGDSTPRIPSGGRLRPVPGELLPVPGPALARLAAAALRPTAPAGDEAFDFGALTSVIHGSNSWVVGPERSASGMPLVANDMHLALNRPAIWYLMGLHAPGLDVAGMSLPGTAGIVAGRTGGVAWGFTNAMVDDVELFLERVDPNEPGRYQAPGGSLPFVERTEVIAVRDGPPDTLTIRETRHGPVITPVEDLPDAGEGVVLALRWVAHDASRTPAALLGMNRARTVEEFLAALADFNDPHQNVVFADTAGRWGYWMAGRIPDRPSGSPPRGAVPGWTGEHDWRGYLPFEAHPHALEPPSGFVATANNRQRRGGVGDRISATGWAQSYRAERIVELLQARPLHDVESLHAIQLDVLTTEGRRFAPVAARAFREAGGQEEADLLAAWDGAATLDSRAASLFEEWYVALEERLGGRVSEAPGVRVPWGVTVAYLNGLGLDGGPSPEAAVESAREVLARDPGPLADEQFLRLDHPLSRVAALQGLFGFARDGIPMPGSGMTVAPASRRGGDGSRVRWGASQRHVSDLATLDRGGFVIPGGQSGWPRGRHSLDQLPLWLEGGLIPLPVSREGAKARTDVRLTLRP